VVVRHADKQRAQRVDEGAAEIVAYDPDLQSVLVINADANTVDILDISDPTTPTLSGFIDVAPDIAATFLGAVEAGPLGPEGLVFIKAKDSPTGDPLLVVGNEVSGTTSIFRVLER
jgi:hypothetical protein